MWYRIGKEHDSRSSSEIDDGENELSAAGCLTTINRILSAPLPKDLYPKIFSSLIPIFNYIFTACGKYELIIKIYLICQGVDFYEDAFPIMNLILYYGQELTPVIIAYYPILLYILLELPPVIVDLQ